MYCTVYTMFDIETIRGKLKPFFMLIEFIET